MTAVDHAELKRLAEGATPGPWSDGPPAWFRGRRSEEDGKRPIQRPGHPGTMANVYGKENAAFIAAANPAVVLALLSEIEGLKAERDTWKAMAENGASGIVAHIERASEAERQLADLRPQAPDSWRPDREVVKSALGCIRPRMVSDGNGRRTVGLGMEGIDQAADAILALRPQTAESGE